MGNLTTDNLGATKPVSTNQLSTDVERVRGAFETFDAAIHAHQTNTSNPHNTTAVQVGAIPDAAGAVNDTRLGTRTADVGSVPASSVGTLTQWVSWTANRIRAITGTVNWFDAPATTLAAAKSHMDATGNPHGATAAQVGAIPATNNAVTDAFVGNRTVDQTLATPANTGTLTQLMSWLAGRIRAITGATNWTDMPATTLAVSATHIANQSNPHGTTAAQVGAPTTTGTGASGTWGISVSGNAGTATRLADQSELELDSASVTKVNFSRNSALKSSVQSQPGALSIVCGEGWLRLGSGAYPLTFDQFDPASKSGTSTLLPGDLRAGLIIYSGTAGTLTLPGGADMELVLGVSGAESYDGQGFEFVIINTGSGACSLAANFNATVGSLVIASGSSGRFRVRKTGANTFVVYRVS